MKRRLGPPRLRWVALAMAVAGILLILVGGLFDGTGRPPARQGGTPGSDSSAGTSSPSASLPTVTEPLIPTRTSTPPLGSIAAGATSALLGPGPPSPAPRASLVIAPTDLEPTPPEPPGEPPATARAGTRPSPAQIALEPRPYIPGRARFGVGVAIGSLQELDPAARLGVGWYLNWQVDRRPYRPSGMEFVQMIRFRNGSFQPDLHVIRDAIEGNPGSLWLIGNEPDVQWQDNLIPESYAERYHELYTLLKAHDPTCQIAIGGVSQPTPLRLEYLDLVLERYQQLYGDSMPVDVWNVHAFILREERGGWGVGIPPGLPHTHGALYDVEQHDDIGVFAAQILDFRRWMRDRGERNKPLLVSEYGILMPEDFGFDTARVQSFMHATFDFFRSATNEELGYPADGDRLVQRWAWYSLSDTRYPTGNLIDPGSRAMTPLGLAFSDYIERLVPP